MHIVRNVLRVLVIMILSLSLSGCLLELARIYGTGIPGGNSSFEAEADVDLMPCVEVEQFHECHFRSPLLNILATFGFLGDATLLELLWLDPVILQVPAGMSDISGTFSGRANGNLSITTVSGPLQADATRQIVPDPGTKFVIIDFPGGVPPGGAGKYHFQFNFTVPSTVATPLALKVIFAAKATVGTQTYYSPLFPCATNMAAIPALTIPTINMFTPINITPFLNQQACNHVTYDLTPTAPGIAVVKEYYHAGFDHYFITPVAAEHALLDARSPPFQDWTATGKSFKAYVNATAPAGSVAVCRFFNSHFGGKSSHFYAAHGFGCEATLAQFPDWGLEDDKLFSTMLPDASGNCPQGTNPVYRVYNQGMGAAPNHRFVTTLTDQQTMVNQGFVAEGVVMCVPP